jgi:hypothetical protein
MLKDADAREALIPELRTLTILEQSPARRIYHAIFALTDAGERLEIANLHERLEEADRKTLARSLMGGDDVEETFALDNAMRCIETLRGMEHASRESDIKARIREAERAGNLAEALALMKTLSQTTGAPH